MSNRAIGGGAWLPKSSSSATDFVASVFGSRRAELGFLAGIGVLTVVMHVGVDWALKLPGHHGLEWMALLMFARTMSNLRYAATTAALSAALTASVPVWGFHETSMGVSYLLAGVVVDALYRLVRRPNAGVLGLIAALGHTTKPLWKLVAAKGFGLHFGSIIGGLTVPVLGHLMFGFVGGTAGALAGLALKARLHRR